MLLESLNKKANKDVSAIIFALEGEKRLTFKDPRRSIKRKQIRNRTETTT